MTRRNNELQRFVAAKLDHQFQHGLEIRRSVMKINDESRHLHGQLRQEKKVGNFITTRNYKNNMF